MSSISNRSSVSINSDGKTPDKPAKRQSSPLKATGSGSRSGSQNTIPKTNSGNVAESRSSLTSFQYGSKSNLTTTQSWVPGQEFSHIEAYDPVEDIIYAYQYACSRKSLKFRQVFRYAKCLDWFLMVVGILLALMGSVITPWLYYWGGVTLHDLEVFARCVNDTKMENGKTVCSIKYYCNTTLADVGTKLFFRIFYGWICYNVIQLFSSVCFTIAADRQTKAMRAAYFESIVRKDMAWFDIFADKDFAKEMTEQITHIRLGIGDVIPNFINLICTVIAMLVIVFRLDSRIAFSFLSFIPFCMGIVYLGNWAEGKRNMLSDKNFYQASLIAKESMVNIKVIKMYEGEVKQAKRFGQALDATKESRKAEVKWMILACLCSGAIWLLLNIATSIVFWLSTSSFANSTEFCEKQMKYGLLSMHTAHEIAVIQGGQNIQDSPGEMLMVYFCMMYITLHAMEIPNFISLIQIAKHNATGVFFIIDWKSRIDNTSNQGKTPKRCAVGRLDFSHVTFRYPQKPEETVLNIQQLTIFSGQFVAFAGPANSGKNTILKLIPRLYDTCSGFITLDAVNLQNYNIHWLRQQMCIISEEPVIFTGTISENIMFGKLDATEDEMIKACQLAQVHHVIENLPDGYNTIITGKIYGDDLTRNEKRQLCLARAYLHRSRLILLENPLKPEDDELEPHLLKFVEHFRDTATVILASTNVTALSKRADCIYYMEHGKILEHGNHIQLIQARGKYYSRLEGTVNTSMETRNKFESQLKAYKYSQMLQKKRKSSMGTNLGSGTDKGDTGDEGGDSGAGDEVPTKKKFVKQFLKMFHPSKKDKPKDVSAESGERKDSPGSDDEGNGLRGGKRKSILRTGKQFRETLPLNNSLEGDYTLQFSGTRKSNEGFMHHGFGMMGFQRMNFARPMTNFSTQIQKQRQAFHSDFPTIGGESLNFLRKRTLSLHPGVMGLYASSERSNAQKGRVRFSITSDIRSASQTQFAQKGGPSRGRPPPMVFPQGHGYALNKRGKMTKVISKANTSKKAVSRFKSKITQKASRSAHKLNLKNTQSVKDTLKAMTDNHSFHLNENVELDNISILTEELDNFLAEYDEGVYTTLFSQVKGYWRDIFIVADHDWRFIIPGIIASVVLGLSIPYQAWIVGTFFQILGADLQKSSQMSMEVKWLIGYLMTTGLVTAIAAFVQEFFFAMAGKRMTRRLREKLFAHILKQDISWFDEKAHDVGILTLQLYTDASIVHHIMLMFYGIMIQATINASASIAIAVIESRPDTFVLTMVYIAVFPMLIFVVYLSSKKELQVTHIDDMVRPSGNFVQEFLTNLKTWFSLGAESFFITNHSKILAKEYKKISISTILTTCLHSTVQTSSWLLFALFIFFCLKYNEIQTYHSSTDDFRKDRQYPSIFHKPTLIGYIMIMTELLIFGAFRIGDQVAILTDVEFGKTAAHKLMRILVNQPETDPPIKKFIPAEDTLEEDLYKPPPEIGLTNISYFYPGTDQAFQSGHLHKISMTIASSSYVAIVGPPGSGKSTLCNIILRMCNPTAGILDFNGDDSYDLSPKVTRRLMGLVEYDPCLFDYTILENINFGKSPTDPEQEPSRIDVEEATKLCSCHYDILDLPEDYNQCVCNMEKSSANFSLKQRIAYARALVRKPKILVIDDATTSVDLESDHKILQVITNVRENRTLIVFSHKIEPVRDADMIFVLWEGTIVESGKDSFLLNKKGYYYEMYMTQKVLADSMRNSPQQLNTIRYNIKRKDKTPTGPSPVSSKKKLEEAAAAASKTTARSRKSSIAFSNFLDDKVNKLKTQKMKRQKEIDKEVSELEREEKQRERNKMSPSSPTKRRSPAEPSVKHTSEKEKKKKTKKKRASATSSAASASSSASSSLQGSKSSK